LTKAPGLRTAKSCGPDAPTLVSSSREASFLGMTVAKKPGHRGEREVTVKTIARGIFRDKKPSKINLLICLCPPLCLDPCSRYGLRQKIFAQSENPPVRKNRQSDYFRRRLAPRNLGRGLSSSLQDIGWSGSHVRRHEARSGIADVVRPPGQHSTRKVRVLTELLIEHFG
jgi:hypothetical protein